MKVWLVLLMGIFIFSGCSTKTQNYKLRLKNAQQEAIIQKQIAEINVLRKKFSMRQIETKNFIVTKQRKRKWQKQHNTQAPKKNIVLKKVEDSNYSSNYMYPKARIKKTAPIKVEAVKTVQPQKTLSSTMTKAECIAMIGSDKFAKYTNMFGSESASLKRCKMLKAMKK